MENEKISIILPIYNVEEYIEQCLESLINQTYKNLEIILVDDGSIDNSSSICDYYASIDSRIKVYHNQNMGVSGARNYGLDVATGDYINFTDPDDYVSNDYIEKLYFNLKNTNSDISMCENTIFKENSIPKPKNRKKVIVMNSQYAIDSMYTFRFRALSFCTLWAMLVKKELYDNIRFPLGRINEDQTVMCELFMLSNKITYFNSELYYYRIRKGSIMQSEYSIKRLDIIKAFDDRLNLLYHYGYNYNETVTRFISTLYFVKMNVIKYKVDYDTNIIDDKIKTLKSMKLKLTMKQKFKRFLEINITRLLCFISELYYR